MTKMAATPIYDVKILKKNLLPQNRKSFDLETCLRVLCGFYSERFPLPLCALEGRYFIVALPEPSITFRGIR